MRGLNNEHTQIDLSKNSSQRAITEDKKKLILEALKKMKADEALVFRLHYLLELSIKEIKKITSFSESKIKVTLCRARQSLLVILKQQLGPEIKTLL